MNYNNYNHEDKLNNYSLIVMSAKVREYFWQLKMVKVYIFLPFQESGDYRNRSGDYH